TIDGGGGNDTILVGSFFNTLDSILSTVVVKGGPGFDQLFIFDEGSTVPHTYTDSGTRIQRTGGGTPDVLIFYFDIESHQLNPGPGGRRRPGGPGPGAEPDDRGGPVGRPDRAADGRRRGHGPHADGGLGRPLQAAAEPARDRAVRRGAPVHPCGHLHGARDLDR